MHYILTVGDDEDDSRLLNHALLTEFPEFEIRHVSSGMDALTMIHSSPPGGFPVLVILEAASHNPGNEFVRRLKAVQMYRRIPVVVISNYLSSGQLKELYSIGANCFLPKPIDENEWHQLTGCIDLLFLRSLRNGNREF